MVARIDCEEQETSEYQQSATISCRYDITTSKKHEEETSDKCNFILNDLLPLRRDLRRNTLRVTRSRRILHEIILKDALVKPIHW